MKQIRKTAAVIIAAVILACIGAGCGLLDSDHTHSFGEWEVLSPEDCVSAAVEVRRCSCGEEETREGAPAVGHSFTAISARCLLEPAMAGMVITPEDLKVVGTCTCGNVVITEGIEVEGDALVLGENTVTVRYGDLSTVLTIQAEKLNIALDAVVTDDTYVASGDKDGENTGKKELGTKSDQYRIYFRVNLGQILKTEMFAENAETAKVQLILSVTSGFVREDTVVTLKAFDPALTECDADFSMLTWNSVDNKEGALGAYTKLHWHNGAELVSGGAGHNVQLDADHMVVTLAYSQIADYVDEEGTVLLALATNTKDLKVGSLENQTQSNHPVFKVILNEEHFHVFDQKSPQGKYLVSAKCKEKAKYRMSCICGEAGTETFTYGSAIDHTYGALVPKQERTCTEDGMRAHYRCTVCGKYFIEKDGKKVVTSAASLKIPAGHNCGKLVPQKDPTCTEEGMKAHYRCERCKKYFIEVDGQKVEVSKEDLVLPKVGHTYSDLVPRKEKTCTEDGMKAHYRCTVCGKYFVEKDGKMVATSEKSLKISAGHDMQMKWDADCHWSVCARGCGHETAHEAHCGGTATETEQAKCEVCGQSYGSFLVGETAFSALLVSLLK